MITIQYDNVHGIVIKCQDIPVLSAIQLCHSAAMQLLIEVLKHKEDRRILTPTEKELAHV